MTKGLRYLALAMMGAAAIPAMAAVPLPMGWYVEGNVGSSRITNQTIAAGASSNSSGIGWNLNLGYKFIPYFATEVGYTSYSTTTAKANGNTVANGNAFYSYYIAGKAMLPISDSGFDIFGKLGLARSHSHIVATSYAINNGIGVNSGTSTVGGLYLGLGAEYALMPDLMVNVQWARANGNSSTGDMNLYSLGLNYTFG